MVGKQRKQANCKDVYKWQSFQDSSFDCQRKIGTVLYHNLPFEWFNTYPDHETTQPEIFHRVFTDNQFKA